MGSANSRSKDVYDLAKILPIINTKKLKLALNKTVNARNNIDTTLVGKELKKIDTELLERGWKSAVYSIQNPPDFSTSWSLVKKFLAKF